MDPLALPEAFVAGTVAREGDAGRRWLASLPRRIRDLCRRWNLELDGPLLHGYVGVVAPVRRNATPLALKVSWVDRSSEHEALALRAWAGRGAVRLLDADPEAGALLMERLDARHSLERAPLAEAVEVAARLLRRLTVPAPPGLRNVAAELETGRASLPGRWRAQGRPFPRTLLDAAMDIPDAGEARHLVNQDLHYGNVLRGRREPWLVIDPKPLTGAPEFGVAPLLWTRCGFDADPRTVRRRLDTVVEVAELDPDRARRWSLFRVVDYWLWALEQGLTEDPVRCRILVDSLRGNAGAGPT